MLTREEQERLTQTGPGTPMGNLLRRYWHAIATVADLDKDPVRPVRLLSEDLVLFRTDGGVLGLIGERCAHRGISLAYGIPQENGLRCAYHGWTYNQQGQVVDMPFEPACLPLRTIGYPVEELGGVIFAYLGPEPRPLVPRWDMLIREDLNKTITPTLLNCNWLQCMDNSFDPAHFEHLHGVYGNYVMKRMGLPPMLNPARHLKIDFEVSSPASRPAAPGAAGRLAGLDDWSSGPVPQHPRPGERESDELSVPGASGRHPHLRLHHRCSAPERRGAPAGARRPRGPARVRRSRPRGGDLYQSPGRDGLGRPGADHRSDVGASDDVRQGDPPLPKAAAGECREGGARRGPDRRDPRSGRELPDDPDPTRKQLRGL